MPTRDYQMPAQEQIENILDQALDRVRQGEPIWSVLYDCPPNLREELAAMASFAKFAENLQKKSAPAPLKRRLYLYHDPGAISRIAAIFSIIEVYWATAIALVLMFGSGAYTVLAAKSSLPGDKLFALKKAYESVEISLARSPEAKAQLQIAIANQRLQDIKQVLAEKQASQSNLKSNVELNAGSAKQPNLTIANQAASGYQANSAATKEDSTRITAAINELNTQTTAAIDNVRQIAAADGSQISPASSSVKNDLIQNIETLTKDQAQVISQADPGQAGKTIQSNQKSLDDIKKIIAANNDQIQAILLPAQNIDYTGAIKSIMSDQIVVDNNTFKINGTQILNIDGNAIFISNLKIGDVVRIQGQINSNVNYASTINVTSHAKTSSTNVQINISAANTTGQSANRIQSADPAPARPVLPQTTATPNTTAPIIPDALSSTSAAASPPVKDTFSGLILEPANLPPTNIAK